MAFTYCYKSVKIMEEKVKVTFDYTIKTIDKTSNPCKQCALSVGNFSCMSRKLCKYTDEKPQVYYFNGVSE